MASFSFIADDLNAELYAACSNAVQALTPSTSEMPRIVQLKYHPKKMSPPGGALQHFAQAV